MHLLRPPRSPISSGARLTAVATAGLLAIGLAACAPEPMAGEHVKGQDPAEEDRSWSQIDDQDDPSLKSPELPDGFPSDLFVLPDGAVIDDAGTRGDRVWFVVLKAPDELTGESWWNEIIDDNGFVIRDQEAGDDGSVSLTLASNELTVSALSIPGAGGTVLLSYDITEEAAAG